MQTSTNPDNWREDPAEDTARWRLQVTASYEEKRKLYPISIRIRRTSKLYPGLKEGLVIPFARTKMAPAMYPIEAAIWDSRGARQYFILSPQDAEILAPVPETN